MAHFPVCSFLEEVSSYQKEDFEAAWTLAREELSENQIDFKLFATSPRPYHDLTFDLDNMELGHEVDPLLSATADLDYDHLLYGPCSPILADFDLGISKPESSSPVEQKQEDIELDYPADIHSYCQQPEQEQHEELEEDEDKCESSQDEFQSNGENMTPPRSSERKTVRRRRQRRGGNKRRAVSSDDDAAAIFSNGKPKLYTQRPFNNPDMERARLNALNAKMNREKKKQEAENLKRELERLRRENEELKKSRSSLKNRASKAEEELARIKQVLERADLTNVLKWSSGK
jgi:hypothetical protein